MKNLIKKLGLLELLTAVIVWGVPTALGIYLALITYVR